ncbi:Retroelement pol polyprotein, partial [Globisporangium splendens]
MPRKKTPAVDRYTFAQPLSALYSDDPAVDKLRANLYATTEKLSSQLIALRNTIPVVDDSDARNYVHEIVVRAQVHVNDLQSILGIFTDRKVKEHKKTRERKVRERAELKRKAQDSQEAKKKPKYDVLQMARLMTRNQDLLDRLCARPIEYKVEGINMPQYHGKIGESVELYFDQAIRYMEAKGIQWQNQEEEKRVLALLSANLKGAAAAWFMVNKDSIKDVQTFIQRLHAEFTPVDLQERLRDQLYQLKQHECKNLEEYLWKFRQLIMQVKSMDELDKITYFVRGLRREIREEVQYCRCDSLSQAMSKALQYDRAHDLDHRRQRRSQTLPTYMDQRTPTPAEPDTAEPMEIDHARPFQHRNRFQQRREWKPKCRYCKKIGHTIEQCYKKKNRNNSRPRRNNGRNNFQRTAVNYFEDMPAEEEDEEEEISMMRHEIVTNLDQLQLDNYSGRDLVVKQGTCEGENANIMLDSGATCNVVKPGFLKQVTNKATIQVTRFDGTNTVKKKVNKGFVNVAFGERTFRNVPVIEWPMNNTHDVILGKPWFTKYQPLINWRTHDVEIPDTERKLMERVTVSFAEFNKKLKCSHYEEVYRIKVNSLAKQEDKHIVIDPRVEQLLNEYSDVFPEKLPNELPPNRRVEFEMNMKADAQPSNRPPFRLSQTEQEALRAFVEENLAKQWIEVSDSPWVSNIFGIPKKDLKTGEAPSRAEWIQSGNSSIPIRWVIDYRHMNTQTIVPKIPLPRIDELFDRMVGNKYFTVIDLAQGYHHQMRVHPNSAKYTAFRTQDETYQWCVAPMGLAGMAGVWSRLMRVLFGKFPFVVVYLDDICVFSATLEEHLKYLEILFKALREEKLYAHRAKCKFAVQEVSFLGRTVTKNGLAVDKLKTTAIENWPTPTTVKELQSFLGLAGYYRRFIYRFVHIVLPLSQLIKKDSVWTWGDDQDHAYAQRKHALQTAPVLKLADFSKPFILTTDASGECVGGVLSQFHDGHDHPIAFYSKKLGPHEIHWPIHEKELFAIKMGLEKWRHYLYGRKFDIYTDNSACSWLLKHPKVSAKLARYLTFFAQFTFTIHHVNGKLNVVADALSRRPGDDDSNLAQMKFHRCDQACVSRGSRFRTCSSDSSDPALPGEEAMFQVHAVIGFAESRVDLAPEVKKEFQQGYLADPEFKAVWSDEDNNSNFTKTDELLFVKSSNKMKRLCVPDNDRLRTRIISEYHDSPIAAHPGNRRTFLRTAQWYYWKTMQQDVKEYVKSCETCIRWKHDSQRKNGRLMPIPIPEQCWQVVSMDFITGLPLSEGYDAILTVVDKLSKRAKYAPTHAKDGASDVAKVFFDTIVRHHGLPEVVISDRDSKFTSKFWTSLMKLMGIKLSMTTSHRPQADGQTERQNLVVEDALRCMISYQGTDWVQHLGMIEYAHATLISASTGFSPFEIDTGRKERNVWEQTINSKAEERGIAEYAKIFAEERQKIVELARKNLVKAQETQKKYYDRKRRVHQVEFKAGDLVMLDTSRVSLKHAASETDMKRAKFAARKIGPLEIIRMINPNVAKLKLPAQMKRINPTFNVDVLSHYVPTPDKFLSRPIPKSSKFVMDDSANDLQIVEKLLKKRQFNRLPEWLVQWHGETEHEATWERERDIRHVAHWTELAADFKERQRELKSRRM